MRGGFTEDMRPPRLSGSVSWTTTKVDDVKLPWALRVFVVALVIAGGYGFVRARNGSPDLLSHISDLALVLTLAGIIIWVFRERCG